MAERERSLSFRVDEASGRTVITVLDATTQEVVRQIPSEEVLALARALEVSGALLDIRI
jgi:flagellar protein FlaG